MDKYKLFFTCTASLLFMSSCYDLDRFPEDQLSAGTFFQMQDHADQAMMGVYTIMRDESLFGRQFSFDCLGGVASCGWDGNSPLSIARGLYSATDGYTIGNKFQILYEGVARANIVLQNVDKCDMSDELKSRYKAEARFMRGLYYFTLLDFWGGVPLYDENTIVMEDFSNMLNPRSSADDVRKFIIQDLDDAIAHLPAKWDDTNKGRATSGAAMALKGKVLLYNKQYQEAATCFESVVNSNEYALYPDYADLFKSGGDESSEMIFAIQNIGGIGQNYGMPTTFYMGNRTSFGSCWNSTMPSTDFVDSYEWNDGRPFDWDEVIPGFNESDEVKEKTFYATLSDDLKQVKTYPAAKDTLLNMYSKRDPRMMASVILPYTTYKGWYANAPMDAEYVITAVAGQTNEANGFIRVDGNWEMYLFRKFVAEYDMDGAITDRAHTPINFPLIRYADVLLMLAECYNQMDRQEEAVELINQVRARVGMPEINSGPDYLQANTKEEVFKRIKHERAVELAGEGLSFSDMKRWGLLETVAGEVKGFTGRFYYNRVVQKRDYLWPFPNSEVEKNPSLKENQNPGW